MRRLLQFSIPMLALAAVLGIARTQTASAQSLGVQACSPTGSASVYQAIQATCPVTAPSQLVAPQTVYVASPSYGAATPVSCQGVSAGTYSTQGTTTTLPASLGLATSGQTVCGFQVTAGIVPAGAVVGSELVAVPYSVSGSTVQLSSYLCGDPSCGTGLAGTAVSTLQPPPPPVLVTISNASSCISPYAGAYGSAVNPYVSPYVPYPGAGNVYIAYTGSANPYICGATTAPVVYPRYGDYDNDGD